MFGKIIYGIFGFLLGMLVCSIICNNYAIFESVIGGLAGIIF
jgi:hypothetical protein